MINHRNYNHFILQTKAILKKNLLCNLRSVVDILREFIFPIIIIIVIILRKKESFFLNILYPFYMPLTFIGLLRKLLIDITIEKSEKYKETLKIMSLSNKAYTIGWMITFYLVGLLIEIVMLIALIPSGLFLATNNLHKYIIAYTLYMISAINLTFLISVFFNTPKLAIKFGSMILGVLCLIYFALVYGSTKTTSIGWFYFCSFIPQTNLSLSIMALKQQEHQNANYIDYYFNYDINAGLIIQACNIFLYLLLYLYFDNIIQGEYGIRKDYLFFLNHFKRNTKKRTSINHESMQEMQSPSLDDYSSAKYHEVYNCLGKSTHSIQINHLVKRYGSFTAVDDLTMFLYPNQIFCLLGHNGAGKTTTINMLVGLIKSTSGYVKIFNQDLNENIDEIRKFTGLCSQKDFLYPNLTVREHLQFIGKIKIKNPNDLKNLNNEINNIIETVGLIKEQNKYARNLSGGNKRKLSLAISIMGGSKLLFLDEPTSGMDPVSRRTIWDLLRNLRNEGRTIILTTHHLEEADEIADRIGIMSKGKLLALGTNEFIKRNFGVGYHLFINFLQDINLIGIKNDNIDVLTNKKIDIPIEKQAEDKKIEIVELIKTFIPNIQINPQTNPDTLSILLPFEGHNGFGNMFAKLEKIAGINFSLEMNTLEDAFINIGIDEEVAKNELEEEKYQKNRVENSNTEERNLNENSEKLLEDNQNETNIKKLINQGSQDNIFSFQGNYNKYSDFSHIKEPKSLQQPSNVTLNSLIHAMCIRKFLLLVRDLSGALSLYVFHLLYIIVAVIILKYATVSLAPIDQALTVARIIMIAYAITGVIYLGTHVVEKEYKIRDSLRTMGMKNLGYWLGTLLTDACLFLLSLLLFLTMIGITRLNPLIYSMDRVIVLMLSFGCSFISYAYLWSFAFKSFHSATHVFPMVLIVLTYGIPYILVYFFRNYIYDNDDELALKAQKVIEIFAMIFCPMYQLQQGLAMTAGNLINSFMLDTYYVALGLWMQALISILIIAWIEKKNSKLYHYTSENLEIHHENKLEQPIDESVRNEEARTLLPNNEDIVKLVKVTKNYRNFKALKGITFGVQPGQIFALLGPNGAGKSTTFNILTCNIPVTSGDVYLDSIHMTSKNMKIMEKVGICSQYDSLWDHLTVKEHLKIYGIMKGLKNQDLNEAVEYYIQSLKLNDYTDVKAFRLSGGNKRKLCSALALLANPKIQFLDEPSTGIDPIAKRFLWNTLTKTIKLSKGSMILTTHSMKEAESLGQKIGILINGKFSCLDTLNQLKNRYSTGYNLLIKKKDNSNQSIIEETIKNIFKSARLVIDKKTEGQNQLLMYQVDNYEFRFSKAFNLLENLKSDGKIENFSIISCSLEQIFIQLV